MSKILKKELTQFKTFDTSLGTKFLKSFKFFKKIQCKKNTG